MNARREPLHVVIAGGGPAAIELLLALHELAEERVELELLAPSPDLVYQPLAVAEAFGAEPLQRFSLARIARDCGGQHRVGALAGVDARGGRALLRDGSEREYGALVIATGAAARAALPGALTFAGERGRGAFQRLLEAIEAGRTRRIVFAVPGGVVWSLPLYELALMTAARCSARGIGGVELTLATPEDAPLALFGRQASAAIGSLLNDAGIALETGVYPVVIDDGSLVLTPGGRIAAEVVVALPRLEGPRLAGVPQDPAGFIPTDRHGRVEGVEGIYAAGDVTTFPVKQGGLATQQADAVAEALAAVAGAPVEPRPFEPVLRGLLLTGGPPSYLRAELRCGQEEASRAEMEPLWWPPSKIAGRHLSTYLARLVAAQPPAGTGLQIEVDDFEPLLRK